MTPRKETVINNGNYENDHCCQKILQEGRSDRSCVPWNSNPPFVLFDVGNFFPWIFDKDFHLMVCKYNIDTNVMWRT